MEEDIPQNQIPGQGLLNNRRNTFRALAMESAYRLTNESAFFIFLKIIYTVIKLSVCILVLRHPSQSLSKPLQTFIKMIVGYDLIFLLNYTYYALALIIPVKESIKSTLLLLCYLADILYVIANILGNYWYYTCDTCISENAEVTKISFYLLVLGYFNLAVPCLGLCCVLLCLPVLILIMVNARPNSQQPATEAVISKLNPLPYRAIEEQINDPCVICSENFKDDEPVIYLACGSRHIFHENCIKTWIKINAVCPICRHAID